MQNEKRRHERTVLNQEIDLSTSDGQTVKAQGVNISESGLLCRTDTDIAAGTYVIFQLPLPGSKMTVSCEGTVLRCGKNNGKYDVIIDFTD